MNARDVRRNLSPVVLMLLAWTGGVLFEQLRTGATPWIVTWYVVTVVLTLAMLRTVVRDLR